MSRLQIARLYPIFVSLVGLLAMAGWVFNIETLKTPLPIFGGGMNFSTALCFFLSGLILFAVPKYLKTKSGKLQILLHICILIQLTIMVIFLVSSIAQVDIGVERLFAENEGGAAAPSSAALPSIGTMVSFIIICILGMVAQLVSRRTPYVFFVRAGVVIFGIGGVAMLGVLLDIPTLCYFVKGWSSAMALPTAFLFGIIGIGFVGIGRSQKQ